MQMICSHHIKVDVFLKNPKLYAFCTVTTHEWSLTWIFHSTDPPLRISNLSKKFLFDLRLILEFFIMSPAFIRWYPLVIQHRNGQLIQKWFRYCFKIFQISMWISNCCVLFLMIPPVFRSSRNDCLYFPGDESCHSNRLQFFRCGCLLQPDLDHRGMEVPSIRSR